MLFLLGGRHNRALVKHDFHSRGHTERNGSVANGLYGTVDAAGGYNVLSHGEGLTEGGYLFRLLALGRIMKK